MYKNLTLTLIACCLFGLVSFSQALDNNQVATAMKTGNATEIAQHFSSRVEISILGESINYSREAAEKKLFEFFDQNQAEDYQQLEEEAESKVDHVVGLLTTESGEYKVSYYLITTHEKHQINHLIISAK